MSKLKALLVYIPPIIFMIGLIPLVQNDYFLTGIYAACTAALLMTGSEKNDFLAFFFGLFGITVSEYFFVHTGVEVFVRNTFFGVMPLWLPFLWAYAFITMKRSLRILDR